MEFILVLACTVLLFILLHKAGNTATELQNLQRSLKDISDRLDQLLRTRSAPPAAAAQPAEAKLEIIRMPVAPTPPVVAEPTPPKPEPEPARSAVPPVPPTTKPEPEPVPAAASVATDEAAAADRFFRKDMAMKPSRLSIALVVTALAGVAPVRAQTAGATNPFTGNDAAIKAGMGLFQIGRAHV